MRKTHKKKVKLLKGEKLMYFVIFALLMTLPIGWLTTKALLSETNITNEKLISKIEKQSNINESLEMQVNELVSMDNIEKVAEEYGLSYISDNIITISD